MLWTNNKTSSDYGVNWICQKMSIDSSIFPRLKQRKVEKFSNIDAGNLPAINSSPSQCLIIVQYYMGHHQTSFKLVRSICD